MALKELNLLLGEDFETGLNGEGHGLTLGLRALI
jgi:hypothetical protein